MGELTMAYPVDLVPQEDGSILARFVDFPEALTEGDDEAEALREAADALEEAVATRIRHRLEVPNPSPRSRRPVVPVPPLTAAKAALYQAMRREGLTNVALARRLGCAEAELRRLLDPRHNSGMRRLEDALAVFGVTLQTTLILPAGGRLLRSGRDAGTSSRGRAMAASATQVRGRAVG